MSKPIQVVVVVVVIVVVFFTKILGPKNVGSKNNPCPKTLGLKVLDPKICWVKKKLGPKNF